MEQFTPYLHENTERASIMRHNGTYLVTTQLYGPVGLIEIELYIRKKEQHTSKFAILLCMTCPCGTI